jgi:hypothetical protein
VTATVSTPQAGVERGNWPRDFALGIRLAVGGGRTSWMRVILGTIGIGLAVAVLLLAASFGNIMGDRDARINASLPNTTVLGGVSPTQAVMDGMMFQGNQIQGTYLHGTGANSPIPPGLSSLPGPNEVVVSPALANLLDSDAGAALRPRFPGKIVGTIGPSGLDGPADLMFYVGSGPLPTGATGASTQNVYSFGAPAGEQFNDPTLLLVGVLGGVALLVPILIFVSVSSRIAGAQRDRRLAALRLVGAGNWQVRRIAAAESLVSAGAGLVLGTLAFLGLRQLAPRVDLVGWSTYTSDVVPSPLLAVLIVLLIPVLAVGTVLFTMRRIIIEPLGVVRDGKPVLRRLWWRLTLIVAGVALLLVAKSLGNVTSMVTIVLIATGGSAMLIGVPAILPWLLERIIGRMRGGAPSWQLAIRRLQLDSGTPARVVSGVAVVLTGTIALQLMLLASSNQYNTSSPGLADDGWLTVYTTPGTLDEAAADLRKLPAAKQVETIQSVTALAAGSDRHNEYSISIASCQTIMRDFHAHSCVDGQGFLPSSPGDRHVPKPGDTWSLIGAHDYDSQPKTISTYQVPANLTPLAVPSTRGNGPALDDGVLLTPGAAAKIILPADQLAQVFVRTDPKLVDASDQIANGVGNLTWQAYVGLSGSDVVTADRKTFLTVRGLLLAGSLFTLLLAGVSMLVLALEHVRERRRPLAMLAAAGVPRGVLSRSLFWQTAVPVVIAVVVATGTGIGLAALVIRMTSLPLLIDWSTIGIFAAAAFALVFLVTAATVPALRGTMRPSSVRTE